MSHPGIARVARAASTASMRVAAALVLGCVLVGCFGGSDSTDGGASLTGTVMSGGVAPAALAAATVTVYAATATGASALAETTTDAQGRFTAGVPDVAGNPVYYVVARKGSTLELAAVVGATLPASVTVNELSTVAVAYAFAQFLDGSRIMGPAASLQIAAGMARNLVTPATGAASAVIASPPNADQTNAWRALGTLGNVLAACTAELPGACASLFAAAPSRGGARPATTLQAIHNIARNPGANVATIFALGHARNAYAPSLDAAQGPDSGDRFQRLDAWTLAVKFNDSGSASCPFGGPGNLAFDSAGYAWITNNVVQGTPVSTTCLIVLRPDGTPADGSNGTVRSPLFGGGTLGTGFGVTIAPNGQVWGGNFGWGGVDPTGSVSQFTANGTPLSPDGSGWIAGTHRVQGMTVDARGNVWVASWGNDNVVVLPGGNANAAIAPYHDGNAQPFGVAVDSGNDAWVTYQGSSVLSKFSFDGAAIVKRFTVPIGAEPGDPKGVWIDRAGIAWVAAGKTNHVHAFRPDGSELGAFTGGALDGPWGLTVDAANTVWVANFGTDDNVDARYRVVQLCGSTPATCPPGMKTGEQISPPSGFTLPSGGSQVLLPTGEPLFGAGKAPSYKPLTRVTAVNVDMAGNVWAVNNWKPRTVNDTAEGNPGGDGVVIFLGLAAPTKAPNVGPPVPP